MDTGWLSGKAQPLIGQVQASTQSWYETALDHPEVFASSLHESGLPETDVHHLLRSRDEAASRIELLDDQIRDFWATTQYRYLDTPQEVLDLAEAQSRWVARLRDSISGRSFHVDDSVNVEFRIPLFVLSAAGVTGCTASFAIKQASTREHEWSITIFGSGLAGSAAVKVSMSSTFTAASGETKVVFLPASVTVEKVTVLDHGRPVGHGRRVNPARLRRSGAPGVLLLPAGRTPVAGELAERYSLPDPSGALATYDYPYERSRRHDLRIGAKAFGADVGLKIQAELETSVTLTWGLRGGYDYNLYRVAEGDGMVWGSAAGSAAT